MNSDFESESVWKVTTLCLGLIVVALFSLSIFDFLPDSTFRIFKHRTVVSLILPQGWDFFTKNPHDPRLTAYAWKKDGWSYAMVGPKSRWQNAFGWFRGPRAQLMEINHLLKTLKESSWTQCEAGNDPLVCASHSNVVKKIKNDFPKPTLCGQIAFVSQEPVPWLWAKTSSSPITMSSKVMKVVIKCFEG